MLTIIFNYTVLLCCCLYYQPVFYRLSIIVLLSVRGFQILYNYEKWSTLLSCRFQQVLKTKRWRFCNFNRKKKIFWDHFGNINKSFEWFIVLFFKATEQLLSIFPFTFLSFNFYFKSCWKTFDNFDDLLVLLRSSICRLWLAFQKWHIDFQPLYGDFICHEDEYNIIQVFQQKFCTTLGLKIDIVSCNV